MCLESGIVKLSYNFCYFAISLVNYETDSSVRQAATHLSGFFLLFVCLFLFSNRI